MYLQDRIAVDGMYTDPDLKAQKHPSDIGAAMIRQVAQALAQVHWDKEDIANFLGCYLSEPKPHIYFAAPSRPLSKTGFRQALHKRGIVLALKSQMQCHAGSIFMNGEIYRPDKRDYPKLRALADERELPTLADSTDELRELLYQWYLDGYISPGHLYPK